MDQTIIFEKTFTQRWQKYVDILSEDIIPKQVMNEWSLYLEAVLDPFGWQAIWKIPCSDCEKFNITYPALALVFVDYINFADLKATIKVLNVQNGISLPECLSVHLCHLWPTEEQDETVCLNLIDTSEALDNFRFFYKHLWRPWDEEDSECNWFKKKMMPRLKLYYDMKQGLISKNLIDCYRLQLIESKEKYQKFKHLQEEVEEDETGYCDNEIPNVLFELHKALVKLRLNLDLFENPYLREEVYKIKSDNKHNTFSSWLVLWNDNDIQNYLKFIKNVKTFPNTESQFKTAKTLQDALDQASAGDVIYIGDGNHFVTSSGNLMEGGKIINANYPKEASIISTNEYLLFNFKNGKIVLQNLKFQLNSTRYGIRIRNGAVLKLENCVIQGYKNNLKDSEPDSLISTQQAIVSDIGVTMELNNCAFSYLGSALSMNNGTAILQNCTVNKVLCCVRAQNEAIVSFVNCNFSHFSECFLHVEIDGNEDEDENEKISGGIDLIERLPDINLSETNVTENNVPVVIITKKFQFRPVRDIFSNPAYNTTLKEF